MLVVKLSEFAKLPLNRVFYKIGVTYIKTSTRTARVQSSGELVYFKGNDCVTFKTVVSNGNYGFGGWSDSFRQLFDFVLCYN